MKRLTFFANKIHNRGSHVSDLHMSDRHDIDESKRKTTLASCSWYQVIVSIYFIYCYPAASQNRSSYRNMNS